MLYICYHSDMIPFTSCCSLVQRYENIFMETASRPVPSSMQKAAAVEKTAVFVLSLSATKPILTLTVSCQAKKSSHEQIVKRVIAGDSGL